jgi:hypothetical protein
MDELKNLKSMRNATWARIKDTEDYKVATHLDVMIPCLEEALIGKASHNDGPVDHWQERRLKARADSIAV